MQQSRHQSRVRAAAESGEAADGGIDIDGFRAERRALSLIVVTAQIAASLPFGAYPGLNATPGVRRGLPQIFLIVCAVFAEE
jgi:hypothetical protein